MYDRTSKTKPSQSDRHMLAEVVSSVKHVLIMICSFLYLRTLVNLFKSAAYVTKYSSDNKMLKI